MNLLFRDRGEIDSKQQANFAEMMDLVAAGHDYYRDLFGRQGLSRGDFRTLADLVKLPLTRKADYMQAPERFRLSVAALPEEMRAVWDVMYTTGSTAGQPTPFVSTTFDFYNILELNRNMLLLRGVNEGDVIANLFPLTLYPHGAFIRVLHAAASLHIPVVSALPGNPSPYFSLGSGTDEVVRLVERHRATILWGVPSYVRRVLARAAEISADLSAVRLVFVTGEATPEASRAELSQCLARAGAPGAQISISYGATEMQGGMVECRPGAGYHNPAPDQFHLEIVDPETLHPVQDGSEGLVLLTHLKRRGTVLLRYVLGDLSVRTRERCPHCGSSTDRLVTMPRRVDQLVKIKGMLVNPGVMVQAAQELLSGREFQFVISRQIENDALSPDTLTLRVAGGSEDPGVLLQRLADRIKSAVGVTPNVEIVPPGELADGSQAWKARRVVDRRVERG